MVYCCIRRRTVRSCTSACTTHSRPASISPGILRRSRGMHTHEDRPLLPGQQCKHPRLHLTARRMQPSPPSLRPPLTSQPPRHRQESGRRPFRRSTPGTERTSGHLSSYGREYAVRRSLGKPRAGLRSLRLIDEPPSPTRGEFLAAESGRKRIGLAVDAHVSSSAVAASVNVGGTRSSIGPTT
jgi:hypothetical protein